MPPEKNQLSESGHTEKPEMNAAPSGIVSRKGPYCFQYNLLRQRSKAFPDSYERGCKHGCHALETYLLLIYPMTPVAGSCTLSQLFNSASTVRVLPA